MRLNSLLFSLISSMTLLFPTAMNAEPPSQLPTGPPHSQMFDSIPAFKPYKMKGANLATPEGIGPVAKGKPLVLLDVSGAGQIVRLHFTVGQSKDPNLYRNYLLRIYFDGETNPSVMAPLGSFFLDAFCTGYQTDTLQFSTQFFANWGQHFVCYLPMPFSKGCRIEIENQGDEPDGLVAYDVLYEEWDECPDYLGRFHAAWRRQNPMQPDQDYVILEAKGRGHYIGSTLAVQSFGKPTVEFLEAMVHVYLDGDKDPVYKVWGSEDYFSGSYYFHHGPYAGPYGGCTLIDKKLGRFNGYRLHIPDAIPFDESIKVVIKHHSTGEYEGRGDYSSVAFWYQQEPHDASFYQGYTAAERALSPLTIENRDHAPSPASTAQPKP